jgi:two-component sensor histidine kinase
MSRLSLPNRLFLLVVIALTPALAVGLLYLTTGAGGPVWYAALVVAVYLAALSVLWRVIHAWCGNLPTGASAPTGPAGNAPGDTPAATGGTENGRVNAPAEVPADPASSREQQLQASLAQREHMLRELHHRVKNNLQMISSLLSLQAERIRSPRIRRVFADAQNRVLTLSVLHRHLYERSNWAQVDFQAFLNDLVRHLSVDHGGADRPVVRFDIGAPVVPVGPDVAIPIGLIVTEAVSNAFRHAFAVTLNPQIVIRARNTDGEFELSIEDNGVGITTEAPTLDDQGGLGFTLLRGLAVQLGGGAAVSRRAEGGTRVLVRFPRPNGESSEAGQERGRETGRAPSAS